jgi:hypothetical protein
MSALVNKELNSTQNGKNIYREGARNAKDVKNKEDFALLRDPQYLPSRPSRLRGKKGFGSGLSGLGHKDTIWHSKYS